ncbi:MAG: hypothetical protein KAS49_02190 [Candidatus Cloacimonetes bacterium]|nr:hypothetical protein [Candidatus Cloacimonadota bacterium]
MKKLLGLLGVILLLAGCTGVGTLTISNNTKYDDVWFEIDNEDIYLLDSGEVYEFEWNLSTTAFGDEEKSVDIEYGGPYVFTQTLNKKILANSDKSVNIYTDAGEIQIWNDSGSFNIMRVYIAPSSDDNWGEDDLSGIIKPGNNVSWYVSPGWWDIMFVDECGNGFISENNYISIEETVIAYYDGFIRTDNADTDKTENSKKYSDRNTIDKVQKN